mmetsp:Transcript_1363/g.2598  ORF Transcript_1363/g.2598 Transcript_1363/m.2598 type:complete len:635 (-) Transcript_1363:231-2135(-)|eukprot:CAMPEP_0167784742 /NCGR_PEP_ID=MMETSP0111_2-20121227/7819_1 /TAXON_ID=91324 /ORGANISM="Lotharella globosa, Strain CCCM811" /LENGTH=634 /DNA_ID=CAMNT_0007675873 /DNA_START=343 /DNA_END=2247 /DNA_ORIENTATION=-
MQDGEAEDKAGQPVESKEVPANQTGPPRTRDRAACPLNKLSVRLLDTYNNINQRYYAKKGLEAKKKKKKRARDKSKAYDYQVVEGAHIGENDRYKIDKEIGKGSFGKVVRAFDTVDKEWVAIKIVKKKTAFLRQAETEIKILQALQEQKLGEEAPKVVRMKNFFKHEKHQCLVFELLYRNLYELLIDTQYKGVSLNLVRKFGKQILQTLGFLRRRSVIHCDLKPENVLMRLKNRSHIKVIDFGSACFASEKAFTYIQSRFYRAPEVLLGIEYSFPIDMWSLGCMLVEMHTGKPLFPGRNEQDQMCKQVEVLGMPPDWMIETGKYGIKHFTKQRDHQSGQIQWVSPAQPRKLTFAKIMEEARRLNTGKRGHSDLDYARFENLLKGMLAYDWRERINPDDALRHSFFRSMADSCTSTEVSYLSRGDRGDRGDGKSQPVGSAATATQVTQTSQSSNCHVATSTNHILATQPYYTPSTPPTTRSEPVMQNASTSMDVEKKEEGAATRLAKMDLTGQGEAKLLGGAEPSRVLSTTSAAKARPPQHRTAGTQSSSAPTRHSYINSHADYIPPGGSVVLNGTVPAGVRAGPDSGGTLLFNNCEAPGRARGGVGVQGVVRHRGSSMEADSNSKKASPVEMCI